MKIILKKIKEWEKLIRESVEQMMERFFEGV